MYKKYFLILLMLHLSNCAAPSAALFAPTITGVATESLARASLSFSTNQIFQTIKTTSEISVSEKQYVFHK